MTDLERDDPRSRLTWRERALISEALAQELLNNPPGLAAAQAEIERLRAALMAIRSITIAADHASQRVDNPVSAYRPAIRNIREAAEEVLDTRR